MKIIISPAKKMRADPDTLPIQDLPVFLSKAEELKAALQTMDAPALQKLWQCNDSIANLNIERLQTMDLYHGLTPAVLAYDGIQYRYMAPNVFSEEEYGYVQEHLRILSGFYGILRPFDGVAPYRLEMQAKLTLGETKDLYAYWGDTIAKELFSQTDCILNLASKEYSIAISKFLQPGIRMITCVFGEEKNGKVVEKGTLCKMARGEMVRFMAQKKIRRPEEVRAFDRLCYRFLPERSDDTTYVFVRESSLETTA